MNTKRAYCVTTSKRLTFKAQDLHGNYLGRFKNIYEVRKRTYLNKKKASSMLVICVCTSKQKAHAIAKALRFYDNQNKS